MNLLAATVLILRLNTPKRYIALSYILVGNPEQIFVLNAE